MPERFSSLADAGEVSSVALRFHVRIRMRRLPAVEAAAAGSTAVAPLAGGEPASAPDVGASSDVDEGAASRFVRLSFVARCVRAGF